MLSKALEDLGQEATVRAFLKERGVSAVLLAGYAPPPPKKNLPMSETISKCTAACPSQVNSQNGNTPFSE